MCSEFSCSNSLFLHSCYILLHYRNPLTTSCIPYLLIEPYKFLHIHPRAPTHKYTNSSHASDDVIPQQNMQRIFALLYNSALSILYIYVRTLYIGKIFLRAAHGVSPQAIN